MKTDRRRLQFRLRSMLILIAVLALPLACVSLILKQGRQEQAAAAWVREMGGSVNGEGERRTLWNGQEVSWWRNYLTELIGDPVQRINLNNRPVRDISRLAACKDLWWLYLDGTNVSDLSAIEGLRNIRGLYFANTAVSDLSPVVELRSLESLDLSNTNVTDLSPLVELVKLDTIYLDGTQVTDVGLAHLEGLKNLTWLNLSDTQVTDAGVKKLTKALPNCSIVFYP